LGVPGATFFSAALAITIGRAECFGNCEFKERQPDAPLALFVALFDWRPLIWTVIAASAVNNSASIICQTIIA
jgi:hypothetical protein